MSGCASSILRSFDLKTAVWQVAAGERLVLVSAIARDLTASGGDAAYWYIAQQVMQQLIVPCSAASLGQWLMQPKLDGDGQFYGEFKATDPVTMLTFSDEQLEAIKGWALNPAATFEDVAGKAVFRQLFAELRCMYRDARRQFQLERQLLCN